MDDELEDEDIKGEAHALPFVMHRELAEQYGTRLAVSLDAYGVFDVAPLPPGASLKAAPDGEQGEQIFWHKTILLP